MKKLPIYALFAFVVLASCSSNDENSTGSETNYLPLNADSFWVYDVNLDAQMLGRDSLYVNGETTINSNIYKNLKTKDTPNGFYTSALNNNNIRKDGDQLLLTGTTGLALTQVLPVNINVSDFVIFKENSSNNTQLDALDGTLQQDLQGFPLKIDYKLTSKFKESLASFSVPGKETYNNVKVMTITANLKVSTIYTVPVLNTPVTIAILDSQDVIVSTQYYAEGVGMIYAKTDVNFQVNDFSQFNIELPIPQQGSSTIEEFLN